MTNALYVAGLTVLLLAIPSPAQAQRTALPALSSNHVLMLGGPTALGDEEGQLRFSLDGAFVNNTFDAESSREPVDGDSWQAGFTWDASFDVASMFEIGVRLRLAWEKAGNSERVGPQLIGFAFRWQAIEQENGLQLALGAAFGQELVAEPSRLVEADVAVRAPIARRAWFDAELAGTYGFTGENDPALGALVLGPVWQPAEVFLLALDLRGRYGKQERADTQFWDLTAALRLAFQFGEGHELAASGWYTLYGRAVPQEAAALLQYRIRWASEGGLLRLDNEGEVAPSHLTDTWDESTPRPAPEGEGEGGAEEPPEEEASDAQDETSDGEPPADPDPESTTLNEEPAATQGADPEAPTSDTDEGGD